jgi:hypothetical protein
MSSATATAFGMHGRAGTRSRLGIGWEAPT